MNMKVGYLIGAVFMTVIILIISFQNFASNASFYMFFNIQNMPMTLPILILSVLGMVAGSLYTLFLQSAVAEKKEEQHEENEGEF